MVTWGVMGEKHTRESSPHFRSITVNAVIISITPPLKPTTHWRWTQLLRLINRLAAVVEEKKTNEIDAGMPLKRMNSLEIPPEPLVSPRFSHRIPLKFSPKGIKIYYLIYYYYYYYYYSVPKEPSLNEDEVDEDRRADDFINKFKKQLRLQVGVF